MPEKPQQKRVPTPHSDGNTAIDTSTSDKQVRTTGHSQMRDRQVRTAGLVFFQFEYNDLLEHLCDEFCMVSSCVYYLCESWVSH